MRRSIVSLILFLAAGAAIAFSKHEQPHTQASASTRPVAVQASVSAVEATPTPTPQPTATPTPAVSWQDNPQGCNEQTQWIALEAPFYCIDKAQPVSTPNQAPNAAASPPSGPQTSIGGDVRSLIVSMTTSRFGAGQVEAMLTLVTKESSFNPYAVNPTSGACGIPQALPCSKLLNVIGSLDNVPGQIEWMLQYIANRYGTPQGALNFHYTNGWY